MHLGAVPKDALPLLNDEEELDYEILGKEGLMQAPSPRPTSREGHEQRALNATPFKKFCRRCRCFKPVRAHHCSLCNRCIVKVSFWK